MKLTEMDLAQVPKEIADFSPIECMRCGYNCSIPKRFFVVEPKVTNEKEYNKLCSLVKESLGFKTFGQVGYGEEHIITVCRCPKCGTEEIF